MFRSSLMFLLSFRPSSKDSLPNSPLPARSNTDQALGGGAVLPFIYNRGSLPRLYLHSLEETVRCEDLGGNVCDLVVLQTPAEERGRGVLTEGKTQEFSPFFICVCACM